MNSLCPVGVVVAASFLLDACATSIPDDRCDGAKPTLADCANGGVWAECGGSEGGPSFACNGASCFWFENGCLAEGYTASVCPAENLCCIENFPYAESEASIYRSVGLASQLSEWGIHPWDRTRERAVDVTLTSLAPATNAISCVGVADEAQGPCGAQSNSGRRYVRGDVFTTSVRPSSVAIGFWTLSIEVTRDADDSLHARVCRLQSTDYTSFRCYDRDPACAVAGTLALDAVPADDAAAATTRLQLHAVFPDGATIDAEL